MSMCVFMILVYMFMHVHMSIIMNMYMFMMSIRQQKGQWGDLEAAPETIVQGLLRVAGFFHTPNVPEQQHGYGAPATATRGQQTDSSNNSEEKGCVLYVCIYLSIGCLVVVQARDGDGGWLKEGQFAA